ncbi:MAG: segregation/condensation protein A [Firmicutes bacterium]|nr:segregation/condensation protein A [Bacillota bacterium]
MDNKLQYKLPAFEGPLDLLLSLISKNKLNICDINVSDLLEQYMRQIDEMRENDMDVASEFLEMAARLVYIKSVMLLPKHEDEAATLKQELTGELLEYQQCKEMAAKMSQMTDGFGCFVRPQMQIEADKTYRRRHDAEELVRHYLAAVGRGQRRLPPPTDTFTPLVVKKIVSVTSKVVFVLRRIRDGSTVKLKRLYQAAHSRSELVATFLAVLELIKADRVRVEGESDKMTLTMNKKERR